MNRLLLCISLIVAGLTTGVAVADDDCQDPVSDWQPKQLLGQQLEAEGWVIHRIKVDDGCYEVKGRDQHGNKVEAEYFPASLRLRKLEMKFDEDAVIPKGFFSGDRKNRHDDMTPETGDRP